MSLLTPITDAVFQIPNQTFYGEEVGVWLVVLPDLLLLFDIPAYNEELALELKAYDRPLAALLSHEPTGIADTAKWQEELNMTVFMHEGDEGGRWIECTPDVLFTHPPFLRDEVEVIHTPGHSPGSVCLYVKKDKAMLTGDTVSGTENGVISDFVAEHDQFVGDIPERVLSCHDLTHYDIDKILPFHGFPIIENAGAKLKQFVDRYIEVESS